MSSIAKYILFAITIHSSIPAMAAFIDSVPGKTQSEREVRWLWRYLDVFLDSCIQSRQECQQPEILETAQKLKTYLPQLGTEQGRRWAELLQFVSEQERPDLFRSDLGETHRVAVTQLAPYSTVYINTDRMNLSLENWVGLLIHEAIHHLGLPDDESRLPDRLGAEVAQNFLRKRIFTSLDQFNAGFVRAVIFNSDAPFRRTPAFLSIANSTSDLDWVEDICGPGEIVVKQLSSAPTWKINRIRPARGIVTVRGGGVVQTRCANRVTQAFHDITRPLAASVDLHFAAPLDLDNWPKQTPTVIEDQSELGPSRNAMDVKFGQAQTFVITDIQHNSVQLHSGQEWVTHIQLRSLDTDYIPLNCLAYYAGTQFSYNKMDNLPGATEFESCKVESTNGREVKVIARTRLPPTLRPDKYYLPVIFFSREPDNNRVAMPVFPSMVDVLNPSAPPPPVAQPLIAVNLKPARSMGIEPVTNSYLIQPGQPFTVMFDVVGPQEISELWLDVEFWFMHPGQFGIAMGAGSSDSMRQMGVMLSEQITRTPTGSRVTMKFQLPRQIGPMEMAAIKFRRFYLRTSDASWVELEIPAMREGMFIFPQHSK